MNTKSTPDQTENTELEANELRRQNAENEQELARLKATPATSSRLSLEGQMLLAGSGLPDDSDVIWRIQAGLTVSQAIQVAKAQLVEDARVATSMARVAKH